jgi:hypothetical protein
MDRVTKNNAIWLSFRTREEVAQDEAREAHEDFLCEPDYCFWCIQERMEREEDELHNR